MLFSQVLYTADYRITTKNKEGSPSIYFSLAEIIREKKDIRILFQV